MADHSKAFQQHECIFFHCVCHHVIPTSSASLVQMFLTSLEAYAGELRSTDPRLVDCQGNAEVIRDQGVFMRYAWSSLMKAYRRMVLSRCHSCGRYPVGMSIVARYLSIGSSSLCVRVGHRTCNMRKIGQGIRIKKFRCLLHHAC